MIAAARSMIPLVLVVLLAACGATVAVAPTSPATSPPSQSSTAPPTSTGQHVVPSSTAGQPDTPSAGQPAASTPATVGQPLAATPPTSGDQAAASTANPATSVTATLRLMGWASSPEEDRLLNEVLADFMRQYPSIQVKFEPVPEYATKLQTDLAAGTAADVFYVDSLLAPDLMKRGLLLDLDAQIARDTVDIGDFYPNLLAAFQWNAKTYGLPKDWSSLALIWNRQLAADGGIGAPPATWADLRAAAQKETNSQQVFGAVTPPELPRLGAFIYQAGGRLVSENRTQMALNSPEGLQALEFYYSLYHDGLATTPADTGTQWPGDTFAKGRAAMVFEGNWIFPFLQKEAPGLRFGIAELPAGPKGKGTFAFTVAYGINARTQSPEAAWTLVNYLTGSAGMRKWTSLGLAMPARKSLEADWIAQFPERRPFLEAGGYARPWQLGPGGQEINDKVATPVLQAVFAGTMSPQDALSEIERRGNAILAQQ
ncbi:MAG: extracellular solute-binding protein [Chloroflexi bacterium]|nr:extracellular solute-binding protein [Chloroflexota bacterium]